MSADHLSVIEPLAALNKRCRDLTKQLAKMCAPSGRLDGDRLDEQQVAIYELSFATAELAGAHASLAYAARAHDVLAAQLASHYGGDVIGSVARRLDVISDALQQPVARTNTHVVAPGRAQIHDICTELSARAGELGPDLIDEDKRLMRATFRQFANSVVAPLAESVHREDRMIPKEIIGGLQALGCFGLCVPEAYGGVRPDDRDDSLGMLVATEELSRASLGAAGSLITRPEILARALLEGGTETQKRHWLPRLARGEPMCAVSVTEPNTGSDVAAANMRATRTAGGWLLNGGKTWCTFAGRAGVIMVIARTDPDARPLHKGLTLFLIEKPETEANHFEYADGRGGCVTGRAIPTLGYRGMHSFETFYDNFFVPNSHVIGEEAGLGRGFYFTMRGFTGGRLQTAARATGLMQAAYDAALRYAQQRVVFGKPVADYPLTEAKLVRMAAHLQSCRQLSYDVAELMDSGEAQMDASLVKLLACKAAEWVTREAMQIHGGMGYAEETPVSRYFVDARVLSIFEGTEETLALRVIGKELLERALQGAN